MRYLGVYKFTLGIALLLLAAGCRERGSEANLRDRIVAAKPSCFTDACMNRSVLAVEDGYWVSVFSGGKQQSAHVPATELANYLTALPLQAWPRGPSVTVTLSDDVSDGNAVARNFEAAQRVCRSLGLNVQVRPLAKNTARLTEHLVASCARATGRCLCEENQRPTGERNSFFLVPKPSSFHKASASVRLSHCKTALAEPVWLNPHG
jgi:hypothetical protein